MKLLILLSWVIVTTGCTILHQAQVGEIDNRKKGRPFKVLVSETGVNLDEAKAILQAATSSQAARDDIGGVAEMISMFQMGPRTGNMVFDDSYADIILDVIRKECPKGKVTGLTSIRESAKYPIVSGEIVKVTGYCIN